MTPIDLAKLSLEATERMTSLDMKVAQTRMQLASMYQDVLKKQIANMAEVAKQRRMASAWVDYQRALKSAKREARKAKNRSELLKERLRDLGALLASNSSSMVKRGWIGYRFFLARTAHLIIGEIDREDLDKIEESRRANELPQGEVFDKLVFIIQKMFEHIDKISDEKEERLKELQTRLLQIRSSSWNQVDIDTSWIN